MSRFLVHPQEDQFKALTESEDTHIIKDVFLKMALKKIYLGKLFLIRDCLQYGTVQIQRF